MTGGDLTWKTRRQRHKDEDAAAHYQAGIRAALDMARPFVLPRGAACPECGGMDAESAYEAIERLLEETKGDNYEA